eukprot:tig00000157_g9706.t1
MHAAFASPAVLPVTGLLRGLRISSRLSRSSWLGRRSRPRRCAFVVSAHASDADAAPLAVPRRVFIGAAAAGAALASAAVPGPSAPAAAAQRAQFTFAADVPPEFSELVNKTRSFELKNGMKFIVLERHTAPVVSCHIHANVGAVNEPAGKTGMAHFLEHLAFKGTPNIGTRDFKTEQPILEKLKKLAADKDALTARVAKLEPSSKERTELEAKLASLSADFEAAEAQAEELVETNEFGRLVEQAGGVGLNATTSLSTPGRAERDATPYLPRAVPPRDATRYFYSFPSNKTELWFLLESERWREPVFRQFYREKEVIKEERRLTVDNSPVGTLVEKPFLEDPLEKGLRPPPRPATCASLVGRLTAPPPPPAFPGTAYGRPVIGFPDDFAALSEADIKNFFARHYSADNLTAVIVGDVTYDQVRELAEKHFGNLRRAGSGAGETFPHEPKVNGPRDIEVQLAADEPLLLEGYHRPGAMCADEPAYAVLSSILSDGRLSRLYKGLVEERKVASSIEVINNFPGERFANLFCLYGSPAPGRTLDDLQGALHAELARLVRDGVSEEEVERFKRQARKALLGALRDNERMASLVAEYDVYTGDWKNLFREIGSIKLVTPADVQRVAKDLFTEAKRCTARGVPLGRPAGEDDEEDEA